MDSASEEKYWRENHDKQPFVKPGHTYEHYMPRRTRPGMKVPKGIRTKNLRTLSPTSRPSSKSTNP